MATTTAATGATTSVAGLASGIQYNDIIDAMVKADRASTAVMETRQATFQSRLDAVRSLNTKLLSYQLDLAALNKPSLYTGRTASSSNTGVLTATTTSAASTGTYQFDVTSVAKVHQLATVAQPSSTGNLGAGGISIQIGTGAVTQVAISAGSSSLTAIAQAINAQGIGVNASVLNDSGGARLLLTSRDTGTANAITISGDNALSGLFTGVTTVQTATDATVRIGSGSGAISVTQSGNTFANIVQGVTLTAVANGTSTVAIGSDTGGVKSAVQDFVDGYNSIVQFMKDNAAYDSTANKAGVLFSEGDVRGAFNSLTQSLLQAVPNRPLNLSTLSSIGVSIDRDTGKLALDADALQTKLAADPAGVARLFTNGGTSSDPGIQFALLSDKTDISSPFAVTVTKPASQALAAATADLDASTVIDSTNKSLALTINGRDYQVTLAEGTYTRQQLASHLQAVFDQKVTNAADKVKVDLVGDGLSLTGNGYGLSASLQVAGAASSVLRLATNKVYGQDVEGTINGVAGTGSGQVLVGATGTKAEGLRLTVTATAPIASATMAVTKGLAQLAAQKVKSLTDGSNGILLQKQQTLQNTVDTIGKSITAADARLEVRRQRYQAQFLAMEKSISQSNNLSSYFNSQVKGFENAASAASK